MPKKRNDPLRGQQGFAMILVLCLGALFVALAAALVYAASLMLANANRQLPEQDAYELAVSFSDVLEQELLNYTGAKDDGTGKMVETDDSSLGYFINNDYTNPKNDYDGNGYISDFGEDTDHDFVLKNPEGVDELTVTLNKHSDDNFDETSNILETYDLSTFSDMNALAVTLDSASDYYKKTDGKSYEISVTVKVVKGNESYACTRKYKYNVFYQLYYTYNDPESNVELVSYQKDGTDRLVFSSSSPDGGMTLTNGSTGTLYLHRYMNKPTACQFTRLTSND